MVPRGVPRFAFLDGEPPPAVPSHGSGRLELAQLADTSRSIRSRLGCIVNRIWQHHFGRGIVATPSNFGIRGEPPSHPELLDWLAARFVASGWSVKAIQSEIVLSQTYQLSSDLDAHNAGARSRRSLALALSAAAARCRIDPRRHAGRRRQPRRTRPGPHPFPPIESWHWTQHDAFKAVYPSNHRSVYLMTQRLVKHPYLAIFDGPDTNVSTEARPSSTVPLQALT